MLKAKNPKINLSVYPMPEATTVVNKKYYQPFIQAGVACVFSSRHLENMSLFYGDTKNSLDNRNNFLRGLGIDYRHLVCARQVHGSRIKYVKEEDLGRGSLASADSIPDSDAFITDKKNLPLAIFTADCLSVFLYDPKVKAIGLIHAGWRSTKDAITEKTIQAMRKTFGTHPQDLYAGFGPSIRSCCYEVGSEFSNLFTHGLIRRENSYYLDLTGINREQLLNSGVKDEFIFDPGICTSCRNEDFFSFRNEGASCGRIMSVAILS